MEKAKLISDQLQDSQMLMGIREHVAFTAAAVWQAIIPQIVLRAILQIK